MTQPRPGIKFTVSDYMSTPEGTRYQLLDGEMILAPSPTSKHQQIALLLSMALHQFITSNGLGRLWFAPLDVVLSNHDVAQPDILFVSNERAGIITPANIQGAPDLVIEILSPSTVQYDRGYKRALYGRHGVREFWLVDPDAEIVEVLTEGPAGMTVQATYHRRQTLTSPLLEGLALDLEEIFG